MTLSVLAGLRWRTSGLVLGTVLLAFGLRRLLRGFTAADAPTPTLQEEESRGVVVLSRLVMLVAFAACLLLTASGGASSPDLLFFWGPKAQQFAASRTIDVAFLKAPFHAFMHAYYPPLVTNLYAFASMVAGRLAWTAAFLTFPLLLGALALGLPGILRASTHAAGVSEPRPPPSSSARSPARASTPTSGETAKCRCFSSKPWRRRSCSLRPRPGQPMQLLAGLLLAGAAVTKVEGLPFVVAAAMLAVFLRPGSSGSRGRARALAFLLAPTAAALAAWFAFGATRGLFVGYQGSGRLFDLHPDHLPIVLEAIARALVTTGYGLPWIVPFVCLLLALPLARRAAIPLGIAAALTAFFLFTYLHRAEDPSQWISWSASRIFSPVAMLMALAVTAAGGARAAAGQAPRPEAASPESPG